MHKKALISTLLGLVMATMLAALPALAVRSVIALAMSNLVL